MPDDTNGAQPSESDIREEMAAAWDMWQPTLTVKRELRDFYRREYEVQYLKAENMLVKPIPYRSGTYDENVDRMVGLLDIPPVYSISAKGLGPRPIEQAEKVERWDNQILAEIEHDQGESFSTDLCHDVVNYGYSALSILPDPTAWADYPEFDKGLTSTEYNKKVAEYPQGHGVPIRIAHVPTLSWTPLLAGRLVLKSFQTQVVHVSELRYRFPQAEIDASLKDTDWAEYIIYIDDKWVVYLMGAVYGGAMGAAFIGNVGGLSGPLKTLRAWRHCIPLKGQAPIVLYEGLTTGDKELKYRWKGFAEGICDTVRVKDTIVSAQATRSIIFGVPTMNLEMEKETTPEMFAKVAASPDFVFGGANTLIPGAKWIILQPPAPNAVEEYLFKKLDERINDAFPPALRGQIDAGTTGYAFNLATEYALARAKPVAQSLARSDVDTMRMIHLTLGALQEMAGGEPVPVAVRYRKDNATEPIILTYDDVADYGALLDAKREASLPIDKLADLQAHKAAVEQGFPWRWATQELARAENPQELMDERMGEDLEKLQPLLGLRQQSILRRMGILRDKRDGMTPQEAGQLSPLPPALQRIIAAMGGGGSNVPLPGEGGIVGPTGMGVAAGSMAEAQGLPPSPVSLPSPLPASEGIAIPGAPLARRNPRAGQKQRPGGPRRKAGSRQIRGAT